MKKKSTILYIALAAAALVCVAFTAFFLKSTFDDRVYAEKKTQMEELAKQLSSTFTNALRFNWACVNSAANMAQELSCETTADLAAGINQIDESLELDSYGAFVIMLDESGRCYDAEGGKGVWGDFDSIADDDERHTFISDTEAYDGFYWAFAKKLSTPVATEDGDAVITHVVLMKSVSELEEQYTSEAYKDVCETYLLRANGIRMYDNTADSSIISSYNIYKFLRSCESVNDTSFDEVLAELDETGVACAEYVINGSSYYASFASFSDYDMVLMYVIPEDAVAANTLSMVSGILKAFMVGCLVITITGAVAVMSAMRFENAQRLARERAGSLAQLEKMNAKLADSNASLEKANLAAETALAAAEAANSAKSSFLSNMSHDIRTPLNAIIGYITLIRSNADNKQKVLEIAGKMNSSSELLLGLINDILDMSRIESGKTTLSKEAFSLDEMLSGVYDVILSQANRRGQHFETVRNYPVDVTVVSDQLRLRQILMNLLSNSVKYTHENGTIRFEVELVKRESGSMADATFVVADNGIGMSKEFLATVFDPFTRAKESGTGAVQGTGLGLAITKSLVELLGGVITVTSEPGHGSEFVVHIPLQIDNSEKSAGTGKNEVPEDILKGMNFLIAEDNEVNAEIIRELLKLEGATCDIAGNGEEAVAMFEKSSVGQYQAVFMDVRMPVMNGYDATRRIRAGSHPEAQTMPIAAMTANAFTEDISQALAAGMNAHITKPVDMKKVKEFMASLNNPPPRDKGMKRRVWK